MPQVTATPYVHNKCRGDLAASREITDDLPASVIGECVTEATQNAWKQGNDPAVSGFSIVVTFS